MWRVIIAVNFPIHSMSCEHAGTDDACRWSIGLVTCIMTRTKSLLLFNKHNRFDASYHWELFPFLLNTGPIPKGPTISAAEISARIFSNVNLTCLIDWHPDYAWDDCPVNWTWQYFSEDLPITGKKYKQHQIQDTGSKCKKEFVLSIFNVTESDEGTYSCLFICNYRNTTKAAVDLKVFVPPPAIGIVRALYGQILTKCI